MAFDAQYPADNIAAEEYFLGSIVLVTGGATNLLLDGQQRLATATILLSVLRDARRAYKADSATRLQNKYISDFDDQSNRTTHVFTLNHYDRDFFRSEIQDEPATPPARPTPTLRSHALVRKARVLRGARRLALLPPARRRTRLILVWDRLVSHGPSRADLLGAAPVRTGC